MAYIDKRAAQFMPFNGLRGFTEQITQAEFPEIKRREITEDHAEQLNEKIQSLHKGSTIVITVFTPHGYVNRICCVKEVVYPYRTLRTDHGNISFYDIWNIETGY